MESITSIWWRMCKTKIGKFIMEDYMKCISCGEEIDNAMLQAGVCFNCGADIAKSIEKYNDDVETERQKQRQERIDFKNKEEKDNSYQNFQQQQDAEDMVLSTTNTLNGYEICGYCGLVFGEVVVKHGFMKQLNAGIDDFCDMISVGDKELSGSAELLESAREIAIKKLIVNARNRGANAVIGIDSETSIGGSLNHITLMGTAVKIKKNYQE